MRLSFSFRSHLAFKTKLHCVAVTGEEFFVVCTDMVPFAMEFCNSCNRDKSLCQFGKVTVSSRQGGERFFQVAGRVGRRAVLVVGQPVITGNTFYAEMLSRQLNILSVR